MDAMFQEMHYEGYGISMPYRLYIPEDYDPTKQYPVIIFLHGVGERGNDNVAQFKHGIEQIFHADSPVYQCIFIAPQCPADLKWVNVPAWTNYSVEEVEESPALLAVLAILESVKASFHVDADRVYVTGLSMGGFGTWDLLVRHSELFAAGIPICGGADPSQAERLANMPIYTFHGLKDNIVPCENTEEMVQALWDLGNTELVYIPYPEGTHGIWADAYETEGLFEWLLSHSRANRAMAEEPKDTDLDDTLSEDTLQAKPRSIPKWLLPVCIGTAVAALLTVGILVYVKKKKGN